MSKYNGSLATAITRSIKTAEPSDDKSIHTSVAAITGNINNESINWYDSMLIYIDELNDQYVWRDVSSLPGTIDQSTALLPVNFNYSIFSLPDTDHRYQKQFNFFLATPSKGDGDMLKSTYDTNGNGVVDNTEKLNNQPASFYDQRAHVADVNVHLSANERAAIANTPTPPNAGNPFATAADVANAGGGDMLAANYANGSGAVNPNKVDKAIFAETAQTAADIDYSNVTNKPLSFPPSSHTHTEDDISDLDKYTQSQVDTNIANAVAGKADKNNVLELNNTSQYAPTALYHPATKEYVDNVGGIPEAPSEVGKEYTRSESNWKELLTETIIVSSNDPDIANIKLDNALVGYQHGEVGADTSEIAFNFITTNLKNGAIFKIISNAIQEPTFSGLASTVISGKYFPNNQNIIRGEYVKGTGGAGIVQIAYDIELAEDVSAKLKIVDVSSNNYNLVATDNGKTILLKGNPTATVSITTQTGFGAGWQCDIRNLTGQAIRFVENSTTILNTHKTSENPHSATHVMTTDVSNQFLLAGTLTTPTT